MLQGHTPSDYKGTPLVLPIVIVFTSRADISESRYKVRKPVFFGAALRAATGPAQFTKASTANWCPNSTIVDFHTSHWVLDEAPDKVNVELEKWINGVKSAKL